MTGVLICCFIIALAVQHDDLPLLSLSVSRIFFFVILAKIYSPLRYLPQVLYVKGGLMCLLSARFLPLANAPRDCHPLSHDSPCTVTPSQSSHFQILFRVSYKAQIFGCESVHRNPVSHLFRNLCY